MTQKAITKGKKQVNSVVTERIRKRKLANNVKSLFLTRFCVVLEIKRRSIKDARPRVNVVRCVRVSRMRVDKLLCRAFQLFFGRIDTQIDVYHVAVARRTQNLLHQINGDWRRQWL